MSDSNFSLIDRIRLHPSYLRKGHVEVAKIFGCTITEVVEAKKKIRSERIKEVRTETTTETETNFDWKNDPNFERYCRQRGINREHITGVKYWQSGGGEPRYSIATDPRSKKADLSKFQEELVFAIRESSIPQPFVPESVAKYIDSGNLAVYHMPDLHLGKVAKDWSLEQACEKILNTFRELNAFARLHSPDRNLIPLGHDLLQVDQEHMTTSGTLVEYADSWPVLFKRARALGSDLIHLAAMEAPTDIQIVPGNHSGRSEFALGEVWDAQFSKYPDINVSNDGKYHPTYEWGNVGLLMSHGETAPWDGLPLLFATVHPELWGRTRYREVLTGHRHISKARCVGAYEEVSGTMLRISPSLSPQDAWHAKHGYNSLPGAEVFIYNREQGLIAHYVRKIF